MAVSVNIRVAVLAPVAVGLKLKATAQVAPTVSEEQEFDTSWKSPGFAPPNATLANVTAELPVFFTLICPFPLASPTGWALKPQFAGDNVMVEAGGVVDVPVP